MKNSSEDPETIKEKVREYYGEAARSKLSCGITPGAPVEEQASSCCAPAPGAQAGLEDQVLEAIKSQSLQLGSGNPVGLADLQPGEVVLDLGSGGGLDVIVAAAKVGQEGFSYGLDMTEEMLELARANASRSGFRNIKFLKGEMEEIPLPDESVDVIISNCVINLSPDKLQTLKEARRVLRPGGRIAVSDIVIDGDLEEFASYEQEIRSYLSWVGCIAGALTTQEFRRTLEEAGFVDVDLEVAQRFSLDDLCGCEIPSIPGLSPENLSKLVGSFTSTNITARRPAG